MPDVTAVVPLKALSRAKGRLAGVLSPDERRAVAAALGEGVLRACGEAPEVGAVLLIAGDEAAAAVGRRAGVDVVVERRPGLAAALDAADRLLRGVAATLVLPADLPDVTAAAVSVVCRAGLPGPRVVIVPTRDGGTGALLRRPGAVMPTAFGHRSAVVHARLAIERGLDTVWLVVPGLARDLDRPGDLAGWLARRGARTLTAHTSRKGRDAAGDDQVVRLRHLHGQPRR